MSYQNGLLPSPLSSPPITYPEMIPPTDYGFEMPVQNGLLGHSPNVIKPQFTPPNFTKPQFNFRYATPTKNVMTPQLNRSSTTGLVTSKQMRISDEIIKKPLLNDEPTKNGILGNCPVENLQNSTIKFIEGNTMINGVPKILFQQSDEFGSILTRSFLDEYNSQNTEDTSTILDGIVVYRNSENTLSQLRVSLSLMSIFSNVIKASLKNYKKLLSKQHEPFISLPKTIIALPIELNPATVENVLGYIHGNSILLDTLPAFQNKDKIPENVVKLFISAKYFNVTGLLDTITMNCKSDHFESPKNFVGTLPEPKIIDRLPYSIAELPKREKNLADTIIEPKKNPLLGNEPKW